MKCYRAIVLLVLTLTLHCLVQGAEPLYHNDFEKAAVGKVPDDLLVLDGAFAVKEDHGNHFLELPGAPLDTFGLLFGPTEKSDLTASARVYGTAKGRRFPTFAVGLNGVSGFRLQVSPAKKLLELYRGDTLKTSAPYEWQSGKWTHLQLQVRKTSNGYQVEGKAWSEGKTPPAKPMISLDDMEELPAGRASVFASPFAETPIGFDDLTVARLEK